MVDFIGDKNDSGDAKLKPFNYRLRNYFKKWPRAYHAIGYFFGPVLFTGLSASKFLQNYTSDGEHIVNVGSGPRVLRNDVINLDNESYMSVHIRANIIHMPFEDASIHHIICEEVLEHADHPHKMIAEIYRILRPGGLGYFAVPFMYPYHSSPIDCTRWTKEGFSHIAHAFDVVESGVLAGPFSALTAHLCYLLALILSFNSERIYWTVMNVSIFIFFPLKFLDIAVAKLKLAEHNAAVLYFVIKKPVT